LYLPFQEVRKQSLESIAYFALIAFAHVLELLGNMLYVGLRQLSLTQELGIAHRPLKEVLVVQFLGLHAK
jgi:hypothetical protein